MICLVVIYMREPGEATATLQPLSAGIRATLWVSALGTLLLGIYPSVLLNFVIGPGALTK